ncbi:hypothetical protein [Thiospirillum jenense]|uniref:Uncharacterized protein n=1 Tax=Thiospirillum jenense TaxID=1653858 RepID=A0A839H971_9GAMM|nr:hypothetical protein [Thiospirillum jenense]MBB1125601.1 hypothetical protein [Thiospirillum jenense]
MTIHKALGLGLAGNELSKKITGTSEVSAKRSAVATGAGATLGVVATEALVIGSTAAATVSTGAVATAAATLATAAAPVVVPLAIAAGAVAFIASLFDD